MYILDIDVPFSPLHGAPVIIPPGAVFYRGYDAQYPSVAERVTHFGTKRTAAGYLESSPAHRLGCFTNARPLRLLDLRYIQVLLRQLFSKRYFTKFEEMEPMARMTLSYGLCGLRDQIGLMEIFLGSSEGTKKTLEYYKEHIDGKHYIERPVTVNPFTPEGIRVGETNNDALSLVSLQEIFGSCVDGFLAPRFESVFHTEKGGYITPEIVLFNPSACAIQQIEEKPYPELSIEQLLNRESHCQWFHLRELHKTSARTKRNGGGKGFTPDTSSFFDQLKRDPAAVKKARAMTKFGKSVGRDLSFVNPTAPHPTEPLAKWDGVAPPSGAGLRHGA